MTEEVAKEIVKLIDEADRLLCKTLAIAEKNFDKSEMAVFKKAVASVLVAMQVDVLGLVYTRYPNLDRHGYFNRDWP